VSLVFIQVELPPTALRDYFGALDNLGLSYLFIDTSSLLGSRGDVTLELNVDGGDHNGTQLILRPDGTWSMLTNLIIGDTQS
jgi:hypothetical protein